MPNHTKDLAFMKVIQERSQEYSKYNLKAVYFNLFGKKKTKTQGVILFK